MKLVYIAGKFRGANAWDVEQNTFRARQVGAALAETGRFMPVIPHVPCFDGLGSPEFWLIGTTQLMLRCDAMFMIPGSLKDSEGTQREYQAACREGMPVFQRVEDLLRWSGKVHALKTWDEHWMALNRGGKKHEIRHNDRGFGAGDALILHRWSACKEAYIDDSHRIDTLFRMVDHVTPGGQFGIPWESCVMSVSPLLVEETP